MKQLYVELKKLNAQFDANRAAANAKIREMKLAGASHEEIENSGDQFSAIERDLKIRMQAIGDAIRMIENETETTDSE